MIKSFKCKETEKIFNGIKSNIVPLNIQKRALIKLHILDVSENVNDLRNPPSNHFHKLKGKRKEQYTIELTNNTKYVFIGKITMLTKLRLLIIINT